MAAPSDSDGAAMVWGIRRKWDGYDGRTKKDYARMQMSPGIVFLGCLAFRLLMDEVCIARLVVVVAVAESATPPSKAFGIGDAFHGGAACKQRRVLFQCDHLHGGLHICFLFHDSMSFLYLGFVTSLLLYVRSGYTRPSPWVRPAASGRQASTRHQNRQPLTLNPEPK